MVESRALRIIKPGMLTTVQDLGRPGHARFGVAPGGALDRGALILGNRLVGNEPGEAALEITLLGPEIELNSETVIAITGGDLGATLNGAEAPLWQPIAVSAGDRLAFAPGAGSGARAYLCVAGGIALAPVMGSLSTELIGAFGGWHGRALQAGDELPLGEPSESLEALLRRRLVDSPPARSDAAMRVVLGPQADRFTERGIATFLGDAFTVTSKSNRQGVRLNGSSIEHLRGADLVSEGIAHGAVQVPGDGQPIVLLAGRQTVGGYIKIATVIGADLDRFAQLRPGDSVRFSAVGVDEAREATLAYRRSLSAEAVTDSTPVVAEFNPDQDVANALVEEVAELAGNWDPDGVIRVLGAIKRMGVTSFAIETTGGFKLEVRRDGAEPAATVPATNTADGETTVTAPVLGVFFRRTGPDLPPFVKEGDPVQNGQVICLIEVMKTYHEVTATASGILAEFLVEDGHFVEYGQPLARIVRGNTADGD